MALQNAINAEHLAVANGKVPPGWSPERDKEYPFRHYVSDVLLWAAATDLQADKTGPACALRIGGSAKTLIREMDPAMLINGQGGRNGLEFLLHTLARRYAPLAQESEVHSLSEFFTMCRNPGESTDEFLSKFQILYQRAVATANFALSVTGRSWLILSHLRIPADRWPVVLAAQNGSLPADDQQYGLFTDYIRRNGHLYDRSSHDSQKTIHQPFFAIDGNATAAAPPNPGVFHAAYHTQFQGPNPLWNPPPAANQFAFPALVDDDAMSFSSGKSDDTEPVAFDDINGVPVQEAGEFLYLQYRQHKRRWRKFSGKGPRKRFVKKSAFRHGKSSGKGIFGGPQRGSGHRFGGRQAPRHATFWADSAPPVALEPTSPAPEVFALLEEAADVFGIQDQAELATVLGEALGAYFKGKSFQRGPPGKNPLGPDGKVLTCSICGSDAHFRAKCPKNSGSQNSSKTFLVENTAPSGSWYFAASAPAETPAQPQAASSSITFADGTNMPLQDAPEPIKKYGFSQSYAFMAFPLWRPFFHTAVRIPGHEGILLDTGAVDNLSGDKWCERVEQVASTHGQGSQWKDIKSTPVEGVGSGASTISKEVVLPLCLPDKSSATFTTAVVSSSELPALMGLNSISHHKILLDPFHKKAIFPGPGGFQLSLSPGSAVFELERASTGHLLLPVTCWPEKSNSVARPVVHKSAPRAFMSTDKSEPSLKSL